jgi:hypothetical protein
MTYLPAITALLLGSLLTPAASAAPPPGHPTPAQARDMLMPDKPLPASSLPLSGQVLSTLDANEFTYVEVQGKDRVEWIAVQRMALPRGTRIRYEEGSVMTNFFSKLLKRTFPAVMFVGDIRIESSP